MGKCVICGKELTSDQEKCCSVKCRNTYARSFFNEETRKKMSLAKKFNPSFYWLGKHRSEAVRQKISEKLKGRPGHSPPKWAIEIFKRNAVHRSGKDHYNWKGGISFEPYSVDWTETLKRSIRERDHYICRVCNKIQGDEVFCVHHIDYDKLNCDPNNLITLCRKCHVKTNYNRDYWKKYFRQLLWKR